MSRTVIQKKQTAATGQETRTTWPGNAHAAHRIIPRMPALSYLVRLDKSVLGQSRPLRQLQKEIARVTTAGRTSNLSSFIWNRALSCILTRPPRGDWHAGEAPTPSVLFEIPTGRRCRPHAMALDRRYRSSLTFRLCGDGSTKYSCTFHTKKRARVWNGQFRCRDLLGAPQLWVLLKTPSILITSFYFYLWYGRHIVV